jgi:uncharacterized membrane protein (DUF2068 family)
VTPQNKTSNRPTANPRELGLFIIGFLKLGKGLLVLALGIGILKLVNKDIDTVFYEIITKLHIDAENRFIQKVLAHLSLISNHTLEAIGTVSLIFASLLLIEGFGLIFQRLWAEYLTVAETAIFIPFEIFELTRRITVTKISILIVNIAIVLYLLITILRKSMSRKALGKS